MVIFPSLNHQEHNRLRIKAFHVKMTQTLLWALNRMRTSIYCNMKVLSFCKFRKYSIRQLRTHSLYYIPIQKTERTMSGIAIGRSFNYRHCSTRITVKSTSFLMLVDCKTTYQHKTNNNLSIKVISKMAHITWTSTRLHTINVHKIKKVSI